MRPALPSALVLLAVAAAPAAAQTLNSPSSSNAVNDRLATQSEIRGIRHQQQFDNNQTRMQIQRNELFRPPPSAPIAGPRR
ncbi:MAG TPA: hypothetical protein VF641_07840 [Methylobacterium sp.]|jgi:hypothetical protein